MGNQQLYNIYYEVQRLSRKGVQHKLLVLETREHLERDEDIV